AAGLPGSGLFFPLSIKRNADDADALVRTLLAVSRRDRSLTFAGDVPSGWTAQLMRANFDRLVAGAASAAADTSARSEASGDCLGIAISCVGRRLVLKDRVEEELEAALQGLPAGTRLVGFYSYGEISPLVSGTGRCELHNQTMTITTLSERQP
ncbi:MAG TPA: FIST C-terminal domain-containing protein, partial [Dermatophilaceae bacterium]|nr:FIST C-terminal domain-containing protein [Dermatophilaceae bacterium]